MWCRASPGPDRPGRRPSRRCAAPHVQRQGLAPYQGSAAIADGASPCASLGSTSLFWRHVALLRARLEPIRGDADVDLVRLAVTLRRREAKQVLAVELVRHAGECRGQILARPDLS